ncbi:hypothetical protein FQA39_LY02174 [Lamprigera yunnana]|nr:hypothetical protein FQA39_LY02174 [Lamprigera yunnana]
MMESNASMGLPQQYNLKWTNHTNNILEMFAEQLLNGLLVDVTLFCDGQFIKAHKMVLSACSPYFQELFRIHTVDHPVIFMNGVRFTAVKQMVEFMYQGEIKVCDEDLDQLLSIAESLQIKGLCKIRREHNEEQQVATTSVPKEEPLSEEETSTSSTVARRRKRRKLSQTLAAAVEEFKRNGDFTDADTMYDDQESPMPPKITRPKNAFMIFACKWRRKLAIEYQGESKKEISMRLGTMWKNLSASEKDEYLLAAKKAGEAHRLKYPDYHIAKAAKAALKERRTRNPRQFKRKKNFTEDETPNFSAIDSKPPNFPESLATQPIKDEDLTRNTDERVETDESNLVIAESQCSDSSEENSGSSKN